MNIFDPHISGSLSVSGSGEISGDLRVLGTISGSIKGDGSQLFNIPSSGVTGLNLTRIADGSATASISSANGLVINTNTEITGTLKLNKVNLGGNNIVNLTLTDGGGKYYINGVKSPRLSFIKGFKYRFNYNNNNTHPLHFSLTSDGEHNGGVIYTTGITTNADPFYVEVEVTDATAATLYYWCDHHVGMGNAISVYPDFLHGQSSINLINVDTEMYATTGSNNFTNIQRTSGSLVVTGSVDVTGSINLFGVANISGSILLNGQAIGTGKLDETTFNSYTSSNDGRVLSIENLTGSYATTGSNYFKGEQTFSGSLIPSGSELFDLGTSTNRWRDLFLAGSTINLGGTKLSKDNSGNIQIKDGSNNLKNIVANEVQIGEGVNSIIIKRDPSTGYFRLAGDTQPFIAAQLSGSFTGSGAGLYDIPASGVTGLNLNKIISGSVSASISPNRGFELNTDATFTGSVNITGSISLNGQAIGTGKLDESTFNTYTGNTELTIATLSTTASVNTLSGSIATTDLNQNNRLNSIETSTGSLNTFTSSIDTTIKSKLDSESVISGSIQVNITGTTGYSTFSSSITSSIGALSSSISTTIGSLSSSIATTTNDLSSSVATTTSGLTLSISSLSSSAATTTLGLSSSIGSLSSSVATTTLTTKNRVDSIEAKTGSYATTGSNIFQGNQTITGSLYISQDLIVAGSSSIQNISSSVLNIGDNIITVNALNPSVRFGGLAVIDSGSSPQVSGSMLFDSVNNQWLFVHQDQASVTSSVLLMGPETFNNLGGEAYLTLNRIPKGTGIEHLNDSNITDNGTKVSINSNTEVTGTLKVTGVISGPTITAIETSTSSLNTFTSSLLTAIELTGSNLTVRGDFLVKGTTTNVNTSTLDVDNNLINLNGSGATFAGLRVKDTTAPSQISGSLLWDSTNDYWVAGQLGSEQRVVRETEFNNAVTRIGNVETSTGSLNSFTSSINTTIKNKLNSDGVISGSVQVNHNATTNYVANQHIDHTTVSITAGSGLTGGGDISATRTINIGAGNGITVNADDIAIDTASATFTTGVKSKLNSDGVISGSAQIDGSLLGSNKTITIGSTSTTLGGTSTSLAGLTSVTSTAFTGSIQGYATSETLSTVTGRGASTTNRITITATGVGGTPLLSLGVSNAASFVHGQETFAPNLTSTQAVINPIGVAGSTKNAGYIGYKYSGTGGSNDNLLTFGHWGADHLMTMNGAGNVSITGTVSASNLSGTNTGDETLARVNALAITTVGTITSGTWNGSAIGNAYLANSSFNIGTTSISLGRASASQTLTGVSIDGASASAPILTASGGLTTQQGNGTVGYSYALTNPQTGLFAAVDNSNSILTVNRHPDNYYSQLGFSSNGNLYYRSFSATAINTSQAWKTIIDSGNIGSQTVSNVSGTVAVANGGTGATGAAGARTNLGLVIGTDVLAYRTFGTAANNNTGDFALVNATTYVGTTAIALNRASASQTLTGVSIDGNAATATSADQIDGIGIRNTNTSAVSANTLDSNGFTYVTDVDGSSSNLTGNAIDGALYSQIYSSNWQHQIYGDYRTGIMYTRGKNSGTWQSWKRVALSSATTFSSVTSLTFTHNLGTANLTAQVFDTNGDMFFPSNIRISSTQVIVTFESSRSGRLVVTG